MRADVVVVGAGIVGLATARAIVRGHPGLSVVVLEKEVAVGTHQSGRNSGVIHAGVYYAPGSAKARLCTAGRTSMVRYCAERGIDHAVCGKVVVARDEADRKAREDADRRIREEADREILNLAGLREEEDLFASVWKSVRNRWTWLALNLVTAFIASRVIGLFEESIAQLVALAALMPIIAGISGNSGNQTITMIVRALALGQISTPSARKLFAKEIGVSALNGLIWGGVVGLFAFLIYHNWQLGAVMMGAMEMPR